MAKTRIKFDRHNYRRHSDENKKLINQSLAECGAGRSVLVDAEGELIAGNGVYEQAQKLGIPTRVVETDGTELVVVKRTDLATADAKRKKLAAMDNATADKVEWNIDALQTDFGASELAGMSIEVPGIQTETPAAQNGGDASAEANPDDYGTEFTLPTGDKQPYQQMTFILHDEQAAAIKAALAAVKETEEYKYCETFGNTNANGNALYALIQQWDVARK